MSVVSIETSPDSEPFRHCPKCDAGFRDLYFGGVGEWQDTIMCTLCAHVMEKVSEHVILSLLAERLDIHPEVLRERQHNAQAEYELTVRSLTTFLQDPL